jgi:hypothetical protein
MGAGTVKVLLACDGGHRPYLEAIANAIRAFRSYVKVAVIDLEGLETEVKRLQPQLVMVSGSTVPSNPVDIHLLGHMEVFPESERPSKFRVGERSWEATPPTVGEILSVVDEAHALYRTSREQVPTDTDGEGGA